MEEVIDQVNGFIRSGRQVILQEAEAVLALAPRIDDRFIQACELMLACQGRVIVIGMGKSGHIGRKIAATLASTGTPSFFVHPGEANHGDLGMVTRHDVVIMISNSGHTPEVMSLIPLLRQESIPLIAMTGKLSSPLALAATVVLDISVKAEACSLGLAPTSSTTATLAMGDALSIALLEARGFTPMDYARSHPGGSLGKRLLLHVYDLMHQGDKLPKVLTGTSIENAILEITRKRLGMTGVVDHNNTLIGLFTDGDLRRAFQQGANLQAPVNTVMTWPCATVSPDIKASEALALIERKRINGLLVVNDKNELVGAFNIHDLFAAGVTT